MPTGADKEQARRHTACQRVRLSHRLRRATLAAALVLAAVGLSGCGGSGGSGGTPAATAPATSSVASVDYFTVTDDGYGLTTPDFLYSSDNPSFWTIQANVAKSATDVDAVCIYRIDIPKGSAAAPALDKTFSIEAGTGYDTFPGEFLVFNGQKSTMNKVESGLISFTADSAASTRVTGTFDVILTDYDAGLIPAPRYRLKGAFHFEMGTYGPIH